MKNSKKIVLSTVVAAMALAFSGCGGGGGSSSGSSSSNGGSNGGSTTSCGEATVDVVLSGDITGQLLDASKTYGINGKVRLTSGELSIPAGTTLAGCTPSSYLIIKPNTTISAIGTQAEPITFTSAKDLAGNSSKTATGEWGGLVILGNAYADGAPVQYEAGDVDDTFGSADHNSDAESSGQLSYVAVKHSGFEVEVDKELNGLSLGGVGSGTVLDHIAIIGGSDDALEAWGGAFNLTGLYTYNAKDDSVDTDLGFTGSFTDVYVKQFIVDKTNNHDSSSIETGNDTNLNYTTTLTKITNFTAEIVGAGIYMKNDAGLDLNNAKFSSAKTVDNELVTYRTSDVMAVGTMAASNVCFDNSTLADTDATTYANTNSKDATADTAFKDWTTNANFVGIQLDGGCAGFGVDTTTIWKGKAGSNDEL